MAAAVDAIVVLRPAGVGVVLDLTDSRVPAVAHWGTDPGEITADEIPPEMMGAHIASGRSHTTGRVPDLAFRAATAVSGHRGMEWDLAQASEAELAELAEGIGFFRAHRRPLLGADLARVDHPAPAVLAHGVVARPGRAISSYALVGRDDLLIHPASRTNSRGVLP